MTIEDVDEEEEPDEEAAALVADVFTVEPDEVWPDEDELPRSPEAKKSAATTTTTIPTIVATRSHGISGDLPRLRPCI